MMWWGVWVFLLIGCSRRTSDPPPIDPSRIYVSPRVPRGQIIADTSLVAAFYRKIEECKNFEIKCDSESVDLELLNPRERITVGALVGEGDFGKVYVDKNRGGKYMIKIPQSKNDAAVDLCEERVILKLLNGLHGTVPRVHDVKPVTGSGCQPLVIDKVGDADWSDVVRRYPDAWFFRRLARLIEVVMSLHDVGFAHGDIKGNNIRVGKVSPEDIFLIDFGISYPFIDENGGHSKVYSRKTDMRQISVDLLRHHIFPKNSWYQEFVEEVDNLEHGERPNYEKWIRCFRILSQSRFRSLSHCPD